MTEDNKKEEYKRKYLNRYIRETNQSFVDYAQKSIFKQDEVGFIQNNAQLQIAFLIGAFIQVILKSAYGKYESVTLKKWLSWQPFNKVNLLKLFTRTTSEMRRLDLNHPIATELCREIENLKLKKSPSASNAKVEFCIYWGMDAYENFLTMLEESEAYKEFVKELNNKENKQ
ncbi:hypothetical protein [Sulfurovum mangrovi]|uniref:hypothetical protein n=1 Tax=Sulfurovum mangrovi TaxID=2893889 RepID=UPI001E55EE74|nr:hypothetical protein [Sulfurovum mangrovi]UFH60007.1 hypothetical protein LN246_03955 [Sulfurovum mangrovi]